MTSISKNVYIDKLDNIVNKCNNTYHRTIKMKPINVKSNTYINSNKGINEKDHKFKIGDHVKISKCKNIFTKGYVPNWSEENYATTKVKTTVPWTFVISDLRAEETDGKFYKQELQKIAENKSKRV